MIQFLLLSWFCPSDVLLLDGSGTVFRTMYRENQLAPTILSLQHSATLVGESAACQTSIELTAYVAVCTVCCASVCLCEGVCVCVCVCMWARDVCACVLVCVLVCI